MKLQNKLNEIKEITPKKIVQEGRIIYKLNEKRHRIHGPAVIHENNDKYWIQNGFYHRIDGPAIELENGNEYWYKNGKLHREDGPAIIFDGKEQWWINDQRVIKNEVARYYK